MFTIESISPHTKYKEFTGKRSSNNPSKLAEAKREEAKMQRQT